MSKFLAVDCSSGYLLVAAVNGEKNSICYTPDCSARHSVEVMGEIERALSGAQLCCGDCDFFAAVTGPGSFTGIRIGISTVKGLSLGAGKPAVGITSFDLAAYNVKVEDFCVVADAAHSHYYACGYGKNKFAPCYLTEDEVKALGCPLFGFGEYGLPGYTRLDPSACIIPAAESASCVPFGELCATYVRKSQAEEGRK